MINLDMPVASLSGVGPVMGKKLERLGITKVSDLLFYFPRAYQDFSKPQPIASLRIGEDAIVKAKIFQIHQSRTRRKWMSIIEAILVDSKGSEIKAIWFNQPFLLKVLKPGTELLFAGKIGFDFQRKLKTIAISQYENLPVILPVYPETEGLTSKFLRKLLYPVIQEKSFLLEDYLPEDVIVDNHLINQTDAIRKIHFPGKSEEIVEARKRLAFEELFLIGLRVLSLRAELKSEQATAIAIDNELLKDFAKSLPFELTNAQRKAAWEIVLDLSKRVPMNRLLEGDVGSGKTVVALMAALLISKNKLQTVWLAPTEILAKQHFETSKKLLKAFKTKAGLLTGSSKNADTVNDDLIIGTHAVLQEKISFPRLALIIIDEQHRFGVKQRAHLRKNGDRIPHLLSMTATPIPRSLALSLYGDLDLSIIDEQPAGRMQVHTRVIKPQDRLKAYDFIRQEIIKGRQAFVICPLIEEKESLKVNLFESDRKSAIAEYEKLRVKVFPDLRIGLLHGKMPAKEKTEMMESFKEKKLDILVSTAVIEVGIDIPNASVMMIESAERFGLAQLHQFRGRVGRGKYQSYCFLFTESMTEETLKRLGAMVRSNNGFELAETDLALRGPGELIGLKQSGLPDLKMASLSDIIMVRKARTSAEKTFEKGLENYPRLSSKLSEYNFARHLE